jgi:MbtH protein
MDPDEQDAKIYKVVINAEEQYSIWPTDRPNAAGWSDVGRSGTKDECLAFIKNVWTDMRPRSLRERWTKTRGSRVERRCRWP